MLLIKENAEKGGVHLDIIVLSAIIIVGFVALIMLLINTAAKRERRIYDEGVETTSVVDRVDVRTEGGARRYYPRVLYKGVDGEYHLGSLNVRTNLPIGRRVRIKYLPNNFERVVFVSQEIGSENEKETDYA